MTCLLGTGKSSIYFGLGFLFSCGLNWFFSTGNHCIGTVCCSYPEEFAFLWTLFQVVLSGWPDCFTDSCCLCKTSLKQMMHLFSPTRIAMSPTWTFPQYDAVKRHGLQEKTSETAGQVLYYEKYVWLFFLIKNVLSTQIWLTSMKKLSYFGDAWADLWRSST